MPDRPQKRHASFQWAGGGPNIDVWRSLVHHQLSSLLRDTKEILFDDNSKFIFFSDCHRGDRGRTDAFAANEMLFLRALNYYFQREFTYVEVGDGDELWQNHRFHDVLRSHWPIFDMLHRFDLQDRLHLILGNHDIPRRRSERLKDGITLVKGLTLRHRHTDQRILVTHGHQADLMSNWFAPLSRLLVRHFWRHMQTWKLVRWIKGERSYGFVKHIERRILTWVESCQQAIICGHTHRARIPDYGDLPYFNTGSFIVPGIATGLELQGGEISLVRWTAHPVTHAVRRELVAPPRKLRRFSH